jgi:hypothetical protein
VIGKDNVIEKNGRMVYEQPQRRKHMQGFWVQTKSDPEDSSVK